MTLTNTLIAIAISYLIGCFQTSYIFGKVFKKIDIRDYGSGNPGATNAIRVFGFKQGMLCLLLDAFKGALAIIIVKALFGSETLALQLLSGIFVIIGHNHPFYMGFKGGKGVAATLGIILAIDWRVFLLAGLPALIVLLFTRIMSLASLSFEVISFVLLVVFNMQSDKLIPITLLALLYPAISFWRHRKNLSRLIAGEEPRLWGKGSKKVEINKEEKEESDSTEETVQK